MYQLSSHELDLSVLKHGLHQSFTDKNNIKQNLAVKLEELSSKLDFVISNDSKKTSMNILDLLQILCQITSIKIKIIP